MCEPGKPCPGAEEGLPAGIAALIGALLADGPGNPAGDSPEEQLNLSNAILFELTSHMVDFMKVVSEKHPDLLETDEAATLKKDLMTTMLFKLSTGRASIHVVEMRDGENIAQAVKRTKDEDAKKRRKQDDPDTPDSETPEESRSAV